MKVSEYRDLIDQLRDSYASLRSAANDDERLREALTVRHNVRCLMQAKCPRANAYDRQRAKEWIDSVLAFLATSGLAARCDRHDAFDAAIVRMAFAGDYR